MMSLIKQLIPLVEATITKEYQSIKSLVTSVYVGKRPTSGLLSQINLFMGDILKPNG